MGYNNYPYARKVGANIEIFSPGTTTGKITIKPNSGVDLYHASGATFNFYEAATAFGYLKEDTDMVIGTQANRNLKLLTGTGKLKFGTYTATPAADSTGYLSVLDELGNARKLMVQA